MAQSAPPVKPRAGPALTPSQLRAERQASRPKNKPASKGHIDSKTRRVDNSAGQNSGEPTKLPNLFPNDPAVPGPRYKLIQTEDGRFKYRMPNGDLRTPKGTFDFVQVDGEIRIAPPKNDPNVSGHLSLSKGKDVDFAGTIQFSQKGDLKSWDNASGHYRPAAEHAPAVDLPQDLFKDWLE
jgi:hypothetical protein